MVRMVMRRRSLMRLPPPGKMLGTGMEGVWRKWRVMGVERPHVWGVEVSPEPIHGVTRRIILQLHQIVGKKNNRSNE